MLNIANLNSADMCYDPPTSSGGILCLGIIDIGGCKLTTPIRNISSSTLTDVTVIKAYQGIDISLMSSIGIDGVAKTTNIDSDEAEITNSLNQYTNFNSFVDFNIFDKGVVYRTDDYAPSTSSSTADQHTIYTQTLLGFSLSSLKYIAEYTKGGIVYNTRLYPCNTKLVTLSPSKSITEGNSGTTTPADFTVTLDSKPTEDKLYVNYTIAAGTATEGTDYSATRYSGTLTFAKNTPTLTQTIPISIIGDDINESNETFTLTITSLSQDSDENFVIDESFKVGTVTIIDDDEGNGGGEVTPGGVTADYNVVHPIYFNNAQTYFNLPTQITKRVETYKVIALDQSTNALKDVNTSVFVELVDADSSAVCSEMTSINTKVNIIFKNQSIRDFTGTDIIDNQLIPDSITGKESDKEFYQKATNNVKFRMSYPTLNNQGIEIYEESPAGSGLFRLKDFPAMAGEECVNPVNTVKWVGNHWQEVTYTQVPQACANAGQPEASAMTQHELNGCLECIYGMGNQYVCSQDSFALRPAAFSVQMSDQNQSNAAMRQLIDDNQPTPLNPMNLAAGYNYYVEVNATNHLENSLAVGYTQDESFDAVWVANPALNCNDESNKTTPLAFTEGTISENFLVNQVGNYKLNITDDSWANVDINPVRSGNFQSDPDCIIGSSTTMEANSGNLNGCNISSSHSLGGAIAYMDFNATFHPYKFDMSTIEFGVGIQPQEINASAGSNSDFVYMSDMSRTDSMNMSLRATGAISASGENNSTLSNFVDNCYAVDTSLSMSSYNNLTHPNTTYQVRFVDTNGSGTVYDSNATNLATGALSMQLIALDDGNFTKDMSGSLNTVTRLNYDRNQTTPLDPMTVQYGELGFKCVTASECTMQADLSATHEAIGSKAMDFNVTHAYGRIIPRDVRVFGDVDFTANAWYEVFNTDVLAGTGLAPSRNAPQWFINALHNDSNDGDGSVTVIIPTTPLALPTHSSSTAGVETYQFSAIPLANIPYSGKAHINTDPWLWYGINALGYADPGMNVDGTTDGTVDSDDCLHHPCFNINVVPAVGATGSAKSGASDKKASKKSDSGEGTWKSTTDYAPAIR
jgi:hypothetical protein